MMHSSRFKYFCLLIAVLYDSGNCELFPIKPFRDNVHTSMFSNERLSLDDCHLRYYKFGQQGTASPAFGEPTHLKEFAHMAAIGWTQSDGIIHWKCGGSLVWDNYVLTAAHCVTDNGTSPDVARLGDINIFSDKDDQYAQQLRIVEIFRHPQHSFLARYNDIALLKLEANVVLHSTVAPVCLWKDADVRFPTMEATGWGDTGYAKERTPSLLKVTLKPISNSECREIYGTSERKLRAGIKDHQICAGDERMDTCPGDSGGPLQTKLLHNGKMTPFLVGVTSFGMICGTLVPGVYTRVSSFFSWIEQTIRSQESNALDLRLDPISCALRYVHLRDYEDDVIVDRSENYVSLDMSKAHMNFNIGKLNHVVNIGWNNWRVRRDNCSGTLIADDTVVTLAECTSHAGIGANFIVLDNDERIEIAESIVHPAYRKRSLYNNIAVLKLKKRVKFSSKRTPACIWHSQSIPSPQLQVAGVGPYVINKMIITGESEFLSDSHDSLMQEYMPTNYINTKYPTERFLLPRASVNINQNCTIPVEFRSRLTRGIANEHLCVGNKLFLVPGSCRLVYGAPMQLPMWRNDRYYTYAYGLNSFGRDCGFGEAAVSTRLFSHVDWLKTVLLPNFRGAGAVHFVNPNWKENGSCDYDYDDGSPGICTHYKKCPKVWKDFKENRIVHFCSSSNVVCCPSRFIQKKRLQDELDTCRTEFVRLHSRFNRIFQQRKAPSPNMVRLMGTSSSCLGSLVTKRIVVTAASCVSSNNPKRALLADGSIVSVKNTTIHPKYVRARFSHNIAMIHLNRPIRPSASVFPACVWSSLTQTPLHLRLYRGTADPQSPPQMVPMYNTDCQRDYKQKLSPHEMCADQLNLDASSTCYNVGDQLLWFKPDGTQLNENTTMTPYLVGIYSYGERCSNGNPGVFTRISSYVEWIRENM